MADSSDDTRAATRGSTDQPDAATGPDSERILGPEMAAVRRPGRPTWILLSRGALAEGLPLGVRVELERPDLGRRDSTSSQRGLTGGRPFRPVLRPHWFVWLATLLVGGGIFGVVGGAGSFTLSFAGLVTTPAGMAIAVGLAWAIFVLLRWSEGAALGSQLEGDGAWLRYRGAMLRVEPAAWRVGEGFATAVAPIALALGGWFVGAGWSAEVSPVGAGLAIGSVLYLIQALYPLRPGPGATLLEAVTGARDLPVRLRWALLSRFVPVPSRLHLEHGGTMLVPAVAFAVWASLTGAVLFLMAASPASGATLAGRAWQLAFILGLILYTLWLAGRVLELVLSAVLMRPGAALKPMAPSPEVDAAWRERNPLTRHLPALREADWRWGTAPRGAVLVRYGAQERHFLWLAEGAASVVGRTPEGDPELVAELRGGGGVGEIALLEDHPRTADVITQEPSIVAILDREEFERVTDEEDRERFKELVQASQALGRSHTLRHLPPDDRGHWLAAGLPRRFKGDDTVVEQEEEARWLGLVVRGRIEVLRDGESVATLGPDEVVGEMAWLRRGTRNATVRAVDETLLWTWDPEFLDRQASPGTVLRDDLESLARERSG